MGIEFKKPLIIGDIDASVKSDISQLQQDIGDLDNLDTADKSSLVNALNEAMDSTLNGASRNLDNLSDLGKDKLRSLNAYANEGELLTDSDGLAFVKKYAHSTFDKSKFTVVGTPTITNDGIASGFSSSSYVTSGDFHISELLNRSWSFVSPIISGVTSSDTGFRIYLCNIGSGDDGCLRFQGQNKTVIFTINTPDDTTPSIRTNHRIAISKNIGINPEKFQLRLDFDLQTGTYYGYYNLFDGNGWQLAGSTTPTTIDKQLYDIVYNNNIPVAFDRRDNNTANQNVLDLKYSSITANGVEVFSGNRTGIDTIKPDNYTVVGSPTISADGVASGFGSSNYINIPNTYAVTSTSNIEFNISISKTSNPSASSSFMRVAKNDYRGTFGFLLGITAAGYLYTSGIVERSHAQLDNNRLYNIKLKCVDGVASIYLDGVLLYSGTYTTDVPTGYITIGAGTGSDYFQHGSINLNALKIYTDGNLVYQSCLKIPYTESKTGSKIVSSSYRNRIADMATQFGFANYYTLDENVGNFTLPQVELYGLIGQRTLRDSYRNGINYWELYSNKDLEQGGSCTSGVEVTFARPFADTNYVLSVPYSAKSSTAFTPTQTGDWIAKGKGLL